MKILINQKTYDKIIKKIPNTNNIFTLISFAKKMYNELDIEINNDIEDNNIKIAKEEE